MATSPRVTSPRAEPDEDENQPRSPSEYKRYSSSSILTDSSQEDSSSDVQMPASTGAKGTKQHKGGKTAQERKNQPTAGKCFKVLFIVVVVGSVVAGTVIVILKLVQQKDSANSGFNGNGYFPIPTAEVDSLAQTAGRIADGTSVTSESLPLGFQLAAFLARNNFNSVRLPLCIESILNDRRPNPDLINTAANRAINVQSYTGLLSSIIRALAFRKISVLLDLHTLTPTDAGGSWTSDNLSEISYLAAVDVLATKLCNDQHWNVIGIDLKNKPYAATWGDNGPNDWAVGAPKIANRMLKGCPNWLAFAQGTVSKHTLRSDDNTQVFSYTDWWGGGLQNEATAPLKLSIPNKLVYAPHYYSPSEYPQSYFVLNGIRDHDLMVGYTEYTNETLKRRVTATTADMFGFLTQYQQGAIVLGEFGGLYTKDVFANLTNRRVIELTMDVASQPGYAGGYVWGLNPETTYEYNPSDTKGSWSEGLVDETWATANEPFLTALKKLDALPIESLEAPVDYSRLDSSSALVQDEDESKEDDDNEGGQSRRTKAILLFALTVLSIGGVVAVVLVLFGTKGDAASHSLTNGSQTSLTTDTSTNVPSVTPFATSSSIPSIAIPTTTTPSTIVAPSATPPVTEPMTSTSAPSMSPPLTPNIGRILDGTSGTLATEETNPTSFPDRGCKLPNYRSHDGQVFIQNSASGVETPVAIKGINWFGLDTAENVPFGLWANDQNGTTIVRLFSVFFILTMFFNSIRLPLNVRGILANGPTNENLVNTYWSPSVNLTTYLGTVSSIVHAFGSRGISILLDLHYLSPTDKDAWFSAITPESNSLAAIDALATTLCNDRHWNVLGLDLKNEPWDTTWGDNGARDFKVGAATLGNRMLKRCPQWLAFVEGNAKPHTIDIKGQRFEYYDWWGGGLQKAGDFRLALDVPAKIVWAPHYYSPSVYPQTYLVKDATRGKDVLYGYSEWTDNELSDIVRATSEDMFGYLRHVQDGAIVFGEFGGLYALDAHPLKTSRRVIQDCMKVMKEPGYAGGYMWSLNPESGYAFNPSDTAGYWEEGLLKNDWVTVNMEYLHALEILDDMPNLRSFPCFT
ncbi:hypothetical protein DYB34_009616 [Aphanomyces astaci]|uniref:Glycoside hydrolase family 5 domain-containing protein n=1 Tax=Aphanomyces astaci TaxID=112090 RepID=A0A418CFV5_APHAT|nr:hypothetical protein DYB34_009616 [Aphanomyces astaci]